MRGLVLPGVVLLVILGISDTIAPGTPAARSVPPPTSLVREQPAPAPRSAPALTTTPAWGTLWKKRISALVRGKSIGISVMLEGAVLYERNARVMRVPASNQKVLLSMALFDLLGPDMRITTEAAARRVDHGVVRGNLFIRGSGDPTVTGGSRFGTSLPIRPTRLKRLARHIKKEGIRRIEGRVVGSVNYFARDWFAPGWKPDFPSQFIALPTALTFDGNSHRGIHVSDPERRAAASLTKKLEAAGIAVEGQPTAGSAPGGMTTVASVQSEQLGVLARFMNRTSSNFFAEVLGKRLAVERFGRPGTIAKGARAIRRWVKAHDVSIVAKDSSGLSYRNRLSPRGLATLLDDVRDEKWWHRLRSSLPTGGEGTLEDRLLSIQVRAKTGTLEGYSALSGWVWLERRDEWAAFSILSAGLPKFRAVAVENKVVRILTARGS